jgi:two-component system, OmpR family, response regulator
MSLPGRPELLIVDAQPVIVEFVTKLLASCASDIRCAYDGQEAVSVAGDFHPDCVITGYVMPRMNGLQEAVEILQFLPKLQVRVHDQFRTHPGVS